MKNIQGWVCHPRNGIISHPFEVLVWIMFASQCLTLTGCRENPYRQGRDLYITHCENCHMVDGSGLGKLIPALDAAKLKLSDPGALICLIKKGLPFNKQTGQQMPANVLLNDVEMTNLINFLGSKYSGNPQTVQVEAVKKLMATCQTD